MSLHDEVTKHGGIRPAARALGIPESTLRDRLKAEKQGALRSYSPPPAVRYPVPERGLHFFILTAAQDCTRIHEDFWNNLLAYRSWLIGQFDAPCDLIVSGFTYNKRLFEEHDPDMFSEKVWFDQRVMPFILNDPIAIGDKLLFCGEMNTLPTAVQPLSGFETYTRDKWGIFPHAKVQLRSIPTQKNALTKQIMTTGAVTLPNYIRKKAGIKAAFHHVCGAVIVAVAPDGAFWCRHIQAESKKDGSFRDLDRLISGGQVTTGHRVEALTYGDIHHEKLDPQVALQTWGYDVTTGTVNPGIDCLDSWLRPHYRFLHDLSDFEPRNHHNIKDHHFRFKTHQHGSANVQNALINCGLFVAEISRPRGSDEDYGCETVIIQSNHDNALLKWIKTADYKVDPENALFFLECELQCHKWIVEGRDELPIFEYALRKAGLPGNVTFVGEDDSFLICGDIECAMHGHLGANGAKASPAAFTRMGSKSNTGHTHSPSITDGNYTSGVSGLMDMGYNRGLSSWCQTHTLTLPNGKRQLLTMMLGRFSEII